MKAYFVCDVCHYTFYCVTEEGEVVHTFTKQTKNIVYLQMTSVIALRKDRPGIQDLISELPEGGEEISISVEPADEMLSEHSSWENRF